MKKNNTVGRHERSEARQKNVSCRLMQQIEFISSSPKCFNRGSRSISANWRYTIQNVGCCLLQYNIVGRALARQKGERL